MTQYIYTMNKVMRYGISWWKLWCGGWLGYAYKNRLGKRWGSVWEWTLFLDGDNRFKAYYQENEYPQIGDTIWYTVYYEADPPYKRYVVGFGKSMEDTPPIFTEQELQEIQKQKR